MYALIATKESKKGNTDNCKGVINRQNDGPYQVIGKGLTNLFDNKHYSTYPSPSKWTEAGCFTLAGSKIVSYKHDQQCPKDVIIPWQINGTEITAIGQSAFSNRNITSITIPNSVTTIDNYAFSHNFIDEVILPSNLTHIGHSAFLHNNITEITIPNSVQSIDLYAFYSMTHLTVSFEEGRTHIADNMFQYHNIHILNLPQSLQSIGQYAFMENKITQLTLPPNLTHIGQYAFYVNRIDEITFPNTFHDIDANTNAFERNGPNSESNEIPEATGTWIFQNNQWTRP